MSDEAATARAILDSNQYMTLATADADGTPWASPVWFATADYHELFWVSDPDTQHSRNVRVRPSLSIVVFDSHAAIGTGQGLYMSATAAEVAPENAQEAMAVFSRRSLERGGRAWGVEEVQAPARFRLYSAVAHAQFLGTRSDGRASVQAWR